MKFKIALIMGSDSDWPIMQTAFDFLTENEIEVYKKVVSAHRSPRELEKFAEFCEKEKFQIIIAGAGGAAHLPGMMAAFSNLPVIGVPIALNTLSGQDSLYSIVQMPKGVPVATVAINNAYNAGVLALTILGSFDQEMRKKVIKLKKLMDEVSQAKKI